MGNVFNNMTRRGFFTALFGGLASGVLAKYLPEQKAPPKKIKGGFAKIKNVRKFPEAQYPSWEVVSIEGDTMWCKLVASPKESPMAWHGTYGPASV